MNQKRNDAISQPNYNITCCRHHAPQAIYKGVISVAKYDFRSALIKKGA